MGGRHYRRISALAVAGVMAAGAAAGLAAAPAAPALASTSTASTSTASGQICVSKAHPKLAARLSRRITGALRARRGEIGLAAADAKLGLTCSLDAGAHFYAASVIKATIISAVLLKEGGVGHLSARQHTLAWQMITESDNDAANALAHMLGGPAATVRGSTEVSVYPKSTGSYPAWRARRATLVNRASSGVPLSTERLRCRYVPVYRQARDGPQGAALAQ